MDHKSLDPVPVVILGGSDLQPALLPDDGLGKHPLKGYKGIDIRIEGRSLIETIVSRLQAAGRFDPIYIAGPTSVYGKLDTPARLIETDGSFGENIRVSVEAVRPKGRRGPIAFTTCDILPDVETLQQLMDDYATRVPCDLWFPLVRAPEDRRRLGASAWKPEYGIVPQRGQPAVNILPGHLVIADISALRLEFLFRTFQLGYRTRNRPIDMRRRVMVRGVLLELLYQDLRHILALRLPTLTWNVLSAGIPAARKLRDGVITRESLEDALRRVFVTYGHRRKHPGRRVHLPIVDALSIAIDLDTEEEARELGAELSDEGER